MRLKDYGFLLTAIVGLGLATPQNVTLDYAQLDGGQDVYTRKSARQFALVGQFRAGSYFELRENRSAVASVLDRDAAALDQPLILRHHLEDGCGNILSDEVRIACKYAGGLSGNTATISGEGLSLSFQQQIPLVLSDAEQGAALSVQATVANANRILYRAPTGAWSALGVGVSGGAVPIVYALARGPDGAIYVGGDFTDGGGSGADYLAKYDPNTGAWSALGSVTAINGPVFALAVGPDGTLYAGGAFTNAGGIAAADYIAKWTGSAWAALATGANDRVEALAIDRYGNLYAGGGFTLMAGVANTVRIAKWNGSAWSALGTGVADNDVLGIAASGDSVFIVGSFTSVGGVGTTDEIAEWTGTQWVAVSGGGLDGGTGGITAYAAADGYVYIGGNFTSAGNVGYTNVVRYGGVDFRPVGSEAPLNSAVYAFANDPGGVVYVGGAFTTVNGVSVPDGLARWDGSTWRQTDVNLPSTAIVYAILATPDGGLYLGFNTGGSAIAAAVTSVVNSGSAHAYPTVTIKGPSSGSSRIYQLINYTTGKAIYFNLTINAGETVTLRFDPLNQGITSDFQGNLIGTILSGSSLSGFDLQSGANNISLYADNSTVTAVMQWRPRYASLDAVP